MGKIQTQLLGCILYSPLIFTAMSLDYYYHVSGFYIVPVAFPIFFVREYRYLALSLLLSIAVSGLLAQFVLADTDGFFNPFDGIKPVLVIIESLLFGSFQLILLYIKKVLSA